MHTSPTSNPHAPARAILPGAAHEQYESIVRGLLENGARPLCRCAPGVGLEASWYLLCDEMVVVHVYGRDAHGRVTQFEVLAPVPGGMSAAEVGPNLDARYEHARAALAEKLGVTPPPPYPGPAEARALAQHMGMAPPAGDLGPAEAVENRRPATALFNEQPPPRAEERPTRPARAPAGGRRRASGAAALSST